MSSYWKERMAAAQNKLTNKSVKQVEARLKTYYSRAMNQVIADFEAVYAKIEQQRAEGKQVTPADLYKLDKYWQAQAQMQAVLEQLGNRQARTLGDAFVANFFDVYYSIKLDGLRTFSTIDKPLVTQMINQIWVADGKSWSQRIWDNTKRLAETLNDELISCVVAGKKTSELKQKLQERFGVSYSAADSLVRTEMAHIQTQAAKKRYEDYGIQQVEIWADPDERRCEVCGKLHQKKYAASAAVPIPAHPRCRCCIVPVVEAPKAE